MKKAKSAIMTAVMLALVCSMAHAANIDGELSVKTNGLDYTKTQHPWLREYSTLPQDESISAFSFRMPLIKKRGLLTFEGLNLGEDDASAEASYSFRDYFSYNAEINKIPHLVNLSSRLSTERVDQIYSLNIMPLSPVRVKAYMQTEDKTGRYLVPGNLIPETVGHKKEVVGGEGQAFIGNAVVTLTGSNEKLSDANWGHEADGQGLTVALRPQSRLWASYSTKENEYSSYFGSAATNTVEIKQSDMSFQYTFNKSLTMTSVFSNLKRTNTRSNTTLARGRARDYDDDRIVASLYYKCPKGSRLSLTYTNKDRDYAGSSTNITNRSSESFRLKAATKVSILDINTSYTNGHRDTAGYTASTWLFNTSRVWNYRDMSGEFFDSKTSVSLRGFKNFTLVFTSNKSNVRNNAPETYGTQSFTTKTNGFTSVYHVTDATDFTLGYYENSNRMIGRQSFVYNGSVLPDLDITLPVTFDTTWFQIGGSYSMDKDTQLFADYSTSKSDLVDLHDTNRVKDRTLSVSVNQKLTESYSADFGYVMNYHDDRLDRNYSNKNTVFTLELTKTF